MERTLLGRWLDAIDHQWLPPRCLVCRQIGAGGVDFCVACQQLLPRFASDRDRGGVTDPAPQELWCLGCGDGVLVTPGAAAPFTDSAARTWCDRCRGRLPPFHRLVSAWRYVYPLDGLLADLKVAHRRPIARALGSLLAAEVRRVVDCEATTPGLPDVILPVVDHPDRRRARGFSPVTDVARSIGRCLSLPVADSAALRVDAAGPLTRQSRAERALAIKGAFRVDDSVYRQRVAIVDDVLTTGATSRELARECLDAGAASVELWTLARTLGRARP